MRTGAGEHEGPGGAAGDHVAVLTKHNGTKYGGAGQAEDSHFRMRSKPA